MTIGFTYDAICLICASSAADSLTVTDGHNKMVKQKKRLKKNQSNMM